MEHDVEQFEEIARRLKDSQRFLAAWDPGTECEEIIRAKSPLRVSFAGGGTDLPAWYDQRGGAVLSSTISRFAYVTLYPRRDREIKIRSVDLGYADTYDVTAEPVYDGVLDLAKAVIRRTGVQEGMSLDIRSDAPAGSGLGGSSALTGAVLGAVSTYAARQLTRYELAELNYEIERIELGISGGKQDQYATTFGGFNLIEFNEDGVLVNPLRIDGDVLDDLEAHLLLCYTGGVRVDGRLVDRQIEYYSKGREESVVGMSRLRELAFEMKKALLRGHLSDFGRLLGEAYENKKRMNPHVAEGTVADKLYDAARSAGALGGKLLGAGGGGYMLFYCETDRQHQVRRSLEALGGSIAHCSFDGMGLRVWRSNSR